MTTNTSSNNRTTVLIVGLLAVIGVIAYFGDMFPFGDEQATGTIAPADRYRSDQVSGEDVQLGDEAIAQLMQTDAFELMINDPGFRA
ncbi:MAG: hypothetical protein O7F72_04960, partial [Proteobacteria bacterium]|nr:hypothetical protein [Pseudomonadota bacterium]